MRRVVEVVARELREVLPAMLFFLVTFHMIAVTKAVVLADQHVDAIRSAVATVAALIVAKAILVVEQLPLARLFSAHLLATVVWKTLLFAVVATAFRVLEEVAPAMLRHESLGGAFGAAFGQVSWAHFWVVQMWLVALLFCYALAVELTRAVGASEMRAMLLGPARRAHDRSARPS